MVADRYIGEQYGKKGVRVALVGLLRMLTIILLAGTCVKVEPQACELQLRLRHAVVHPRCTLLS